MCMTQPFPPLPFPPNNNQNNNKHTGIYIP